MQQNWYLIFFYVVIIGICDILGVKSTFGAKKISPLLKRMKKKQKKFVLQISSLTLIDAEKTQKCSFNA